MSGAAVVVGAVVFDEGGRLLLVKRGKPPSMGTWTLPGGHVEAGETVADAVVREVLEETGLEVTVVRALEVVTIAREGYAFAIHEHLCAPRDPRAVPRAASDAADARWARLDELADLGVTDAVKRVVEGSLRPAD